MSESTVGCHSMGGGCCYLVGRGQECCSATCSTHTVSHRKESPSPKCQEDQVCETLLRASVCTLVKWKSQFHKRVGEPSDGSSESFL